MKKEMKKCMAAICVGVVTMIALGGCGQTKVEDNYRIKITFHHSFQRLKGSVKRLKQICNFCLIRDAVNRFFSLKKSIRVRKQ